MQLPTQKQFVDDCLAKYWFTEIPADQKWEAAHFPLPACSGEGDTVLLWSADHTVQGLLQSVEFDYQCFHGKANKKDLYNLKTYYPEYLPLFEQLRSHFCSRRGKITAELKVGVCGRSADQMTANGKKTAAKNKANGTSAFFNPKVQLANGKKTSAQKWQCLVTGHICNAGPLSRYQKKRGIDTSLRIQLPADFPGQIPSPMKNA